MSLQEEHTIQATAMALMGFTLPQVQSSSRSGIFLMEGTSVINAAYLLTRNLQQ